VFVRGSDTLIRASRFLVRSKPEPLPNATVVGIGHASFALVRGPKARHLSHPSPFGGAVLPGLQSVARSLKGPFVVLADTITDTIG